MTTATGHALVPVDPVAWPLAVDLLSEARAALNGSLDGPPARVGIVPGEAVALDDCCAGQLWVRIGDVAPAGVLQAGLDLAWRVDLEVGVLRCAPSLDQHGAPPTAEQEQAAAAAVADDAARLRRAARCEFAAERDQVVVGPWRAIGPQGGCVGGLIRLSVTVFDCDCAQEH